MVRKTEVQTLPGLGARLNDVMFREATTRRQLVQRSGISHETINQALRDRASFKTVEKLEQALRLEPGTLTRPAAAPGPVVIQDLDGVLGFIERAFSSANVSPEGARALLDGLEEASRIQRRTLPDRFWTMRRAVHDRIVSGPIAAEDEEAAES